MKTKEVITVITIRCIDMAPSCDDIDKRPCAECGEMTWLSNLWREKKIDKIICQNCFYKSKEYLEKDFSANVTEETLEQAVNLVKCRYDIRKTDKEIREKMIKDVEGEIGKKINIIQTKKIKKMRT